MYVSLPRKRGRVGRRGAGRPLARRDRKYLASRDRLQPAVRKPQQQSAAFVERLATSKKLAAWQLHAHLAADCGGAVEPIGADAGKPGATPPLREAAHHRAGQRRKQILSGDVGARGSQIGRRICRLRRMMHAVHADADGDRKPCREKSCRKTSRRKTLAFEQNAGELGACAEEVIRPFERKFFAQAGGAIEDRVMNGKRGDEGQFRRVFLGGRRIAEQQRGEKIAGRGNPLRPAAAAARRLPPRRDPQRTTLAAMRGRQRLRIGRRQRLVGHQAKTCSRCRGIKSHQNREWAAALAIPTSGPG